MKAFHVAESSNSDHETDIPAEAMETEAVVENVQPKPPTVGMGFTSESEVREFYNEYAKAAGFGIAKIRTKNDEDGKQIYFSLGCSRHGKSVSNAKNSFYPRPSSKIGCKASINVVVQSDEVYVISFVNLEHNHDLSPGKARYFRNNKKLDDHVKRKLVLNDIAGISMSKNFNSCVVESGGHENLTFGYNEARSYVANERKARLGISDSQALGEYFIRSQTRNSNFFYAIDLDAENRIRNVFWADARCRAAYECFNDVITFDTTYLTNRYDMPFAPFVGVNHHGQSILLGCGLISNEDTDTFTWLFTSWLTCMFGQPPKAIITDQCKAIGAAIAKVFPSSCHRLCLWHIMKKLPMKLGGLKEYKSIKREMKNIVYDSLRPLEFEDNWKKLVEEYGLEDNSWMNSLYEERYSWVPVFVKDRFWAGMSTTQRSESMNAFFDGYVNSGTTLRQFVEQYDSALKDKMEKESSAEFSSFNCFIPTISDHPIEQQFQAVYTNDMFKLFQGEFRGLMYCNASLVKKEGSLVIFEVTENKIGKDGSYWKKFVYDVTYNEVSHVVKCLCCLFECKGLLCKHALSVLIKENVFEVPSCYILDRWRNDIKRHYLSIKGVYDDSGGDEQRRRHNSLSRHFYEVQQLASESDERHDVLVEILRDAKEKILALDSSCGNKQSLSSDAIISDVTKVLRTPVKVRTKGRPPMKRNKSRVEEIVKKVQRKSLAAKFKDNGKGDDRQPKKHKRKQGEKGQDVRISMGDGPSTAFADVEIMTQMDNIMESRCEDILMSGPFSQET